MRAAFVSTACSSSAATPASCTKPASIRRCSEWGSSSIATVFRIARVDRSSELRRDPCAHRALCLWCFPMTTHMQTEIVLADAAAAVWCSFFFSRRRRHTRWTGDWSSDVCSSDLEQVHIHNRIGMMPFPLDPHQECIHGHDRQANDPGRSEPVGLLPFIKNNLQAGNRNGEDRKSVV